MKKSLAVLLALWPGFALAQDNVPIPNHSIPIGRGPGTIGWGSVGPCNTGQVIIGNTGADPSCGTAGAGGGVTAVSNADGTLTISPTTGAVVASLNLAHANTWSATQTFSQIIDTALVSGGTQCVQASASGQLSGTGAPCGSGSGSVTSVSNADGTLTISPTTGVVVASLNLANANTWTVTQTFSQIIDSGLASAGTQCVQANASGQLSGTGAACGSGSGAVNSVTNSDGTLTISPTTGAVVASIALGHANTWTGVQTFSFQDLKLSSSTVASLTACAAGNTGVIAPVTNSNTARYGDTVASGANSFYIIAECDGTNWQVMGNAKSYLGARTTSLWPNQSPPAQTNRFGDRILAGDATQNPDTVTLGPCSSTTGDWLTNFQVGLPHFPGGACAYWPFASMVIESKSNNGANSAGLLVAGTGQFCTGNCGAYGMIAIAVAQHSTGHISTTWAIYSECDVINDGCTSLEMDVANYSGSASTITDPFTGSAGASGASMQLGCGNGDTGLQTCATAINITLNGSTYNNGINFFSGSLGQVGASYNGSASFAAITMPDQYSISWYSAAHTINGAINVGNAGKMNLFGPNGLSINNNAGVSCVGTPTPSHTTVFGITTVC